MARITIVKSAQQRYETKPVLDDQGQPVRIPLTNKDGSPKMTRAKGSRAARPVFITKTVADKDRPKPLLRCDFPGCEHPDRAIQVGQSYKWIKPKSGPYGGRQLNRHAEHPSWNVWDYSSSLSARTQQISHDAEESFPEDATTEDEISDWAAQVAEEIRSLAEEKREAASNIEDGFGHETYQSDELNSTADDLDSWADDVENIDVPEAPQEEDFHYDEDGNDLDDEDAERADGWTEDDERLNDEGQTYDEALADWLEEARSAGSDLVNECPV